MSINNGDERDNIGDKIVNEIWDKRDKKIFDSKSKNEFQTSASAHLWFQRLNKQVVKHSNWWYRGIFTFQKHGQSACIFHMYIYTWSGRCWIESYCTSVVVCIILVLLYCCTVTAITTAVSLYFKGLIQGARVCTSPTNTCFHIDENWYKLKGKMSSSYRSWHLQL